MIWRNPDGQWTYWENHSTIQAALQSMKDRGWNPCEVRSYSDGTTFTTVTVDGEAHRVALKQFPGIYAMNLTDEYVSKLESLLQREGQQV